MDAQEAMKLGFCSRIVPKENMVKTATGLAAIMAGKNSLGLRMTKEAININMDAGGLEACLQMEDRNQMMLSFGLHFQAKGAKPVS
jgi:enoyl-CoA hydratase/carnithine racemase